MSMLTDEHKKLGVDFDGEKFFVRDGDQTYNYTKLEDAVNYAKSLAREDSPARDNSAQEQAELRAKAISLPLTTAFTTAAGEVAEEIDIITAECVFGINLFKDMLGGIRDIVGGRAGAHQRVLKDLRQTCLQELRINAVEIGADAVIGVDLDYSEISGRNGGLLMLVASGTAVTLVDKSVDD